MRMADMSGMLSRVPGKESYILPPIKYPDGKYYLKIGGDNPSITVLHSHQEIAEWFRSQGQHEDDIDDALDILYFIIPDLCPISVTTSCCVSSHTPILWHDYAASWGCGIMTSLQNFSDYSIRKRRLQSCD